MWILHFVRCVCTGVFSVDGLQQRAFLLREHMSSGLVPLSMTSGEAIIFCINDEQQQPEMREMDFVPRRRSALIVGNVRKENSSHKQLKQPSDEK